MTTTMPPNPPLQPTGGGQPVQPSRVHYFYADCWPSRLWFGAFVPLSIVGWWNVCGLEWSTLLDATTLLLAIVTLVLCVALGQFIGVLVGFFVLGPLYYGRMLKNGGPFQPGDTVQILRRSHRGRIARVYSAWQGDSVRVDLGDPDNEEFTDVFGPVELLRVEEDPPRPSAA